MKPSSTSAIYLITGPVAAEVDRRSASRGTVRARRLPRRRLLPAKHRQRPRRDDAQRLARCGRAAAAALPPGCGRRRRVLRGRLHGRARGCRGGKVARRVQDHDPQPPLSCGRAHAVARCDSCARSRASEEGLHALDGPRAVRRLRSDDAARRSLARHVRSDGAGDGGGGPRPHTVGDPSGRRQ
jgi:hypothetical protein